MKSLSGVFMKLKYVEPKILARIKDIFPIQKDEATFRIFA